jgi:hypothetical protein
VKLLDHLAKRGNAAGQIPEKIELVAVVDSEVGINGPDQDGVDRAVGKSKARREHHAHNSGRS